MRKTLLFLAIACFAIGLQPAFAQTNGGPDAYGYMWYSDADPDANAPTYAWVDITTTGTEVTGLADDNAVGPFNIGFDFPYYWSAYDQVWIGSNGWISFKQIGNIAHCFPQVPSPGGNGDNFVAPFMTDLSFSSSYPGQPNVGKIYWWSNGTDSLIIAYHDVPWWKNDQNGLQPPDWVGSNTFEVIYTKADSSITVMYNNMDAGNFNDTPGCDYDLEIGWENVTGNIGWEIWKETVPASQSAVRIVPPVSTTLQIPDATPAWNANADNAGQFFLNNRDVDLLTNIANVGNADINTPITVDGEIRSLQAAQVWSGQETVSSLNSNSDNTVTFSNQWSITNAGQYYYEVDVTNNDDINPSNNDNTVEISVVEQGPGGDITLSYATQNGPDAIAGFGPNDGLGIKIVPPGYPVDIVSVSSFLLHDTTMAQDDIKITIYDDDAPAGQGTVLGTVTLAGSAQTDNDWNDATFATPITINDGGFFVEWIVLNAGNAFLGSEAFGPISRRTYEVIAGTWATYRQNTVEEMLINVNVDGSAISVEDEIAAGRIAMEVFPNPTRGISTVNFGIPAAGEAHVSIMTLHGQQVFSKTYGTLPAGEYNFTVDTQNFGPGVYMITMESNGESVTRKLVVTR